MVIEQPLLFFTKTHELDNLKFNSNNRSLEICKRKIGEKINTLIDDLNDLNEEEIKEMKKAIKKEIEDLKEISNENSNSLYGTKVNLKGEKEIIFRKMFLKSQN